MRRVSRGGKPAPQRAGAKAYRASGRAAGSTPAIEAAARDRPEPADGNGARRLAACLLSHHELALAEFRSWLSAGEFQLHMVLIESSTAAELRRLDVPPVSVYVVDALAPRAATEALVGGLIERFAGARILVMAKHFNEANTFPLLRLGVKGVVEYAAGPQDLARAALHIASGAYWVPRDLLSRFVDQMLSRHSQLPPASLPSELSRREQEVLQALLQNLSNKEIANNLNISERTAKFHVSNLLGKFGVRRRADLIVLYYQTQGSPMRIGVA